MKARRAACSLALLTDWGRGCATRECCMLYVAALHPFMLLCCCSARAGLAEGAGAPPGSRRSSMAACSTTHSSSSCRPPPAAPWGLPPLPPFLLAPPAEPAAVTVRGATPSCGRAGEQTGGWRQSGSEGLVVSAPRLAPPLCPPAARRLLLTRSGALKAWRTRSLPGAQRPTSVPTCRGGARG